MPIRELLKQSCLNNRIAVNNIMTIEDITEAIVENYSDTDQWEATDKAKTIMMELDDNDDE